MVENALTCSLYEYVKAFSTILLTMPSEGNMLGHAFTITVAVSAATVFDIPTMHEPWHAWIMRDSTLKHRKHDVA